MLASMESEHTTNFENIDYVHPLLGTSLCSIILQFKAADNTPLIHLIDPHWSNDRMIFTFRPSVADEALARIQGLYPYLLYLAKEMGLTSSTHTDSICSLFSYEAILQC